MLTRIEIDGFKTFRDLALDVPPFLVVLGRNASGKSNLFDAIRLLSSTADRTLMDAAGQIRGEPHELLATSHVSPNRNVMTFAVEVLLDPEVSDDFGDVATVQQSRLRYELALTLRAEPDRPTGVLPDIANDLASVVPEVSDVQVLEDSARRLRQVFVTTRDDEPYSAGVASDGTLRALALLTALYDPERRGLICYEEPENGIYPQRLVDLIEQLSSLVREKFDRRRSAADAPLSQLLMSSHSPVILRVTPGSADAEGLRDDVAFFDSVTRIDGQGRSRVSRVRQVRGAPAQAAALSKEDLLGSVAPSEIDAFEVWRVLDRVPRNPSSVSARTPAASPW